MKGRPEIRSLSGLSADVVREELNRILASREFHATDRMREFLRFVVEETLAGRAEQLKAYTIATRVFGRGKDFDAIQDPIVRIEAGRLRRSLERYYLVAGGADPVNIDIPKGRYIPYFTERTPGARVDDGRPDPRMTPPGLPESAGPAVAVLPLQCVSADDDQRFFCVGLADDLVTEMNRFQDVVVIPCLTADASPEAMVHAERMGRGAGARFLLGGTVRRDEKTAKVTMRLIDVLTDRQIWSQAYTHPLEASLLIATQEEIARSVVAAVCSEYGIIARRLSAESRKKSPAELDTYEAMLRYYSYQIAPEPEASTTCFAALQRAVEREPDYGPAWSALATIHCQLYSFDVPGFNDSLETALDHARRGVSLEPGSQLCRLILAYASYLDGDADTFYQEIETTLTLNPNSPYHVGTVGYMLVMMGDPDRGLPLLARAVAANPSHPNWFHTAYFAEFFRRGEYDRALLELENHRPVRSYWVPVLFATVLGKLGRVDEAAAHVEEIRRSKPDFARRARELFRRTLKDEALLDELIDGLRRSGLDVAKF